MLPSQSLRGLLALAVSTLLFVPTARAQDISPATAAAPAAAEPAAAQQPPEANSDAAVYPASEPAAAEPESDDGRLPRLKSHSVGLGYHSVFFATDSGKRFLVHGPSVVYDYFVGRRIGFALHGEAFFTAFGHEAGSQNQFNGPLFGLYPDRHSGFDVTFMVAYRRALSEALTLFVGGGAHARTHTANGAEYRINELITAGVGGNARFQYAFHPLLTLNADLFVALDPFDMIDHDDPAVITVPFSGSVGIGARW